MAQPNKSGPYVAGPNDDAENGVYVGDCRDLLAGLFDERVSCAVTSPPC